MAGYDPSDSEERRVMKAHYFQKSMISKGQLEEDALRIASRYYHVSEESVKNFSLPESPDPLDDDIWFMLGGHTPVSATELFNEGDFFLMGRRPNKYVKFKDIPVEFVCAHRTEIENACDKETSWWCYCGRLVTGLHTSTCRQYRKHFQTKMEELYNANSN